ncbi:MAG: TonB-dependent receptor [Acidobacteria bacterium]|nr:TonB-dependent receptor [Acidobacteriota bacterium]
MRRRIFTRSLEGAMLLGSCTAAFAQGTGAIHGAVTDPSGLGIPLAKVTATLTERGTTRTADTDAQGAYLLPLLPIGTYSVTVEGQGFKVFQQQGIILNANENLRVDAQLSLGSVTETVSVTAEASLIEVRSSMTGTLIDPRRVLELPINGRNVIGLATLLPGASQVNAPQTFTGDRSGSTVSMSGSRGNEVLYLFDGANFAAAFRNTGLSYPPPDALQEVKVLTNSFSAEYGRNAGSIFNVVTRSGTNEIHGSAWEFLRNSDLNARNFFAVTTSQLVQNQFGAAAGAPIRKNKLFVFGSYEGLRIRPAALSASGFPLTAAERTGDFSAQRTAVRDPLSGQPFPNNQIPASRIDSVAGNILSRNLMPLPNQPGGQYITNFPTPQNKDLFLIRTDWNHGKHTIDGRYNYNWATQVDTSGNIPSYLPLNRTALTQSVTIGDTFTVKPTLVNQTRVSFNRFVPTIQNLNPIHLSDLGGNFPVIGPKIPPAITVTGRVTLGSGSAVDALLVNQMFQLTDSVIWTRGAHSVRTGFELLKLRYLNRSFFLSMGTFNFTSAFTGNPAADFLIGRAESMQVGSPALEQTGLQTNTYYFIQDDWRIRPRFTLNLGLRYELSVPWTHPWRFAGTWHPGQQSQVIPSAPVGLVYRGDAGVPTGLYNTDKNNFAPRIGFAWDPFARGRTSIRGAYGIFYEAINANIVENDGQPFRYAFTFSAPFSLADPLRGQPPIPLTVNVKNPVFVGQQQITFPDPTLRSPYVQHATLNVQHEVVKDLLVQVGYVGKVSRKLWIGVAGNPAIFGPGATLSNLDQRRIYPSFGDNQKKSTQGNASYSALQIEVNKRFSRGFSMQGAYTWSRSIDLASGIAEGSGVPNVFNLRAQKGLSDFQAKHIASFSWIWDLPRLTSSPLLLRNAAGGWQVNGLVTMRSGTPLNIVLGSDVALTGTPNQRPNVTGNPVLSRDRPRQDQILSWFDRTVFARPATGAFGNVGRNPLIGPPAANTNLGLFKNFSLPGREGLRLQFRSEFFNVFNSVNLGSPNNQLAAGDRMGRITSADSPRQIQFALKVLF